MNNMMIDVEMPSFDNDNIHSKMMLMNNKIKQLMQRSEVRFYNTYESVMLTASSTLADLHKNLIINGVFKKYIRGTDCPNIPPKLAANQNAATGVITACKMDENYTIFTYDAYGYIGVCFYNEWESQKVSLWHVIPQGRYFKLSSSYYNNDINNILYDGEYYFYNNNFSGFPTTEPCVLSRIKVTETLCVYEVTTINTIYIKKWASRNGTMWVSIPSVHPNNASGGELRIGDMTIDSNGDLVIRVNSSTVKKI